MKNTKQYISANGQILAVGQRVMMPEPKEDGTDSHQNEFAGRVEGFHDEYVTVQDGDGDCFDIEPERVIVLDDHDYEIEPEFCKTNKLKVTDSTGKEIDLFQTLKVENPSRKALTTCLVVGFFGGILAVSDENGDDATVHPSQVSIQPDPKGKFFVWNDTDGITAAPDKMTMRKAAEFAKQFPRRYDAQGYYRDNRGDKLPPETIRLIPKAKLF